MSGMSNATVLRIAAALCWILGGLSIVGIPILWPLAYYITKRAEAIESHDVPETPAGA